MVSRTGGIKVLTALTAGAIALAGCGGEKGGDVKAPAAGVDLSIPVELNFHATSGSVTQEFFDQKIARPLAAKYPQFKINYIKPGTKMDELLATGTVPDFMWLTLSEMRNTVLRYQMQQDVTPLVNSTKYDLNRFDPAAVQTIQNVSGQGKMLGLPDSFNPMVLFYNKDLFDRFGIGYPKDGMTWDEAYELARKMTRSEGGAPYRGMGMFYRLVFNGNQLSLPLIDAESAKPLVNSLPGWKRLLDNVKRFYDIEGNMVGFKAGDGNADLVSFINDRNMAMVVSPLSSYNRDGFQHLNWDMVSAPVFADAPKVGFQAEPRIYFITSDKHKEQAYHAILHLLSDEVQIANNKLGQMTSLKDDQIRRTFGQETPALSGKNTGAVYFNQFAATPAFNPNVSTDPATILAREFSEVLQGKFDVNTGLRNTEEKIQKAIEAEQAASAK